MCIHTTLLFQIVIFISIAPRWDFCMQFITMCPVSIRKDWYLGFLYSVNLLPGLELQFILCVCAQEVTGAQWVFIYQFLLLWHLTSVTEAVLKLDSSWMQQVSHWAWWLFGSTVRLAKPLISENQTQKMHADHAFEDMSSSWKNEC